MAGDEGDGQTRAAEFRSSDLNTLHSQIHGDSLDTFSLPSQPLDVKNWFSSYEYESPECSGLPDYLGSYLLPEEDGEIDTQENPLDSSPDSTKFIDLRGDYEGKDSVFDSEINIDLSRTSGNLVEDDDFKAKRKISSLISKEEVSEPRLENKHDGDGFHSTRAEKDRRSIDENSSEELVSVVNEEGLNQICKSNEHSKCKESIHVKSNVADDENAATNGFISTKNRRNSWIEGGACHSKVASTMNCKNKEIQTNVLAKSGKRSVLVDRTNILGEADTVLEIAGKWQCTRKNKPYMGPPLKQLRMEQWFHRVSKDHSIR
ncbi:hypothetical protein J5N97_018646 [Dioscorea zingiberensis]|uniref:Uncharacterized protein n=1 Tax=Dioscorea zingiberensis TaxID=325984 RepID=A0A9D5CCH7_9LILI|nr:hypothetical protein J5N97_018646 [Dioscorea zingiberensis]